MALKKIPYTLETVLKKNLSKKEDSKTRDLLKGLSSARKRGYLNKKEFIEIILWKTTGRSVPLAKLNPESKIIKITKQAFCTNYEKRKIEILTSLSGVEVPVASAILTLISPRKYGVIDVRAWQVLYQKKKVNTNPSGANPTVNQWYQYQNIIRHFAKKLKVTPRNIDLTLYIIHSKYQKGTLYGK
jgi:thermostable 8-oxoguanine DNA glycosylase